MSDYRGRRDPISWTIPSAIFSLCLLGGVVVLLHSDDEAWMADLRFKAIVVAVGLCFFAGLYVYWRRNAKRTKAAARTASMPPAPTTRLDTVVVAVVLRGGAGQRLAERLAEWRTLGGRELVGRVVQGLTDHDHSWVAVACLDDDPVAAALAPDRIDVPLDRLERALPELERGATGYRGAEDDARTVVALGGTTEARIENVGGNLDAERLGAFLRSLTQVRAWQHTRVVAGAIEQDALDALPMAFEEL